MQLTNYLMENLMETNSKPERVSVVKTIKEKQKEPSSKSTENGKVDYVGSFQRTTY